MAKLKFCGVEGCEQILFEDGKCRGHFLAAKHLAGSPLYRRPDTCTVDGCNKPHRSNGLCEAHYHRLYRYGSPTFVPTQINSGPCKVPGCQRPSYAHGMCASHFKRQRKTGSPAPGKPMLTAAQVQYIRDQRGKVSIFDIAEHCNTSARTVVAIQAGRSWGFLKR